MKLIARKFLQVKKLCCYLIATFFSFIVSYFALALLLGLLSTEKIEYAPQEPKDIVIYVASNGVHLNLWLPSKTEQFDWQMAYPESYDQGNLDWISIGWGSKAFYTQVPTWNDLTLPIAWKALIGDSSVIRLSGEQYLPSDDSHRRKILLSHTEYQMLVDDLRQQFQSNQPIEQFFYPAIGSYSPLSTCNDWIRQRFNKIGLTMPLWSPFDIAILWHLP